jgi:hypothetical protein
MLNRYSLISPNQFFIRLALGGPGQSLLTVGSVGGVVSIWHVGQREKVGEVRVGESLVSEARMDREGARMFVVDDEGVVALWKARD